MKNTHQPYKGEKKDSMKQVVADILIEVYKLRRWREGGDDYVLEGWFDNLIERLNKLT